MRPWFGRLLTYGLMLMILAVAAWEAVYMPRFNREACQSNLLQLQVATITYAHDYDQHLPLRPTRGDWVGLWGASPPAQHWEGDHRGLGRLASGPLLEGYVLTNEVAFCPADRGGASGSYSWNYALAGLSLSTVEREPLVWDSRPFHRGGRNVAFMAGNAVPISMPAMKDTTHWYSEADFAKLEVR